MAKPPAILLSIGLLTSCAPKFYPVLVTYYDETCKVEARQMELSVAQRDWIEDPQRCVSQLSCANEIATKIIEVPLSAIVAGSIVVAGDTVFWLEKQGQCIAK